MNFNDFKNKVNLSELGGVPAQFKLAPKIRLKPTEETILKNNPKKAAVLALFYPNKNNTTSFLLTQRATYKGTHSAQISFPGGKVEKKDSNLKETALRETFEEVGVLQKNITIIKELTDVYIPPSNFLVTPFVGVIDTQPNFIINNEVAKTIEVAVNDLLDETSFMHKKMNTSYMKNIEVPCFYLNNYIVWGATAMMLSEIKELLK